MLTRKLNVVGWILFAVLVLSAVVIVMFRDLLRIVVPVQGVMVLLYCWYTRAGLLEREQLLKKLAEANLELKETNAKLEQTGRELMEANAELEQRATIDALTGLFNRGKIVECLKAELLRVRRYNRPTVIGMPDLDHFKAVNTNHGHPGGDIALRVAAKTLQGCLRTSDLLGRLGGEEFLLVLPETTIDGGLVIAERCRQAIEERTIRFGGIRFKITVSIGLTVILPTDKTVEEILGRASEGVLRAKNGGRNRVHAMLPGMDGDGDGNEERTVHEETSRTDATS